MQSVSSAEKKSLFFRFINGVEVVGNKLPHPFYLFCILCVIAVALSVIFSGASISYMSASSSGGGEKMVTATVRNLLNTEEACMEWHFQANDKHGGSWQIDIIHIVKGSRYDGFFERVADRIKRALTDETRLAILRLKSETPANEHIMGIEYYQAVLRDGVRTWHDFCDWRKRHAACGITEWMP